MISNAKGCHHLDPEVIDRMEALVTGRTDETLMEQFGISYCSIRCVQAVHHTGPPTRGSLAPLD